jgi:hypothetical protein
VAQLASGYDDVHVSNLISGHGPLPNSPLFNPVSFWDEDTHCDAMGQLAFVSIIMGS